MIAARRPLLLAVAVLPLILAAAPTAGQPFFTEVAAGGAGVVLAHREGPIQLLSLPELAPVLELRGPDGARVEGAAMAPSGRWLAADYQGGSLWIWDLTSGEKRLTVPRAVPRASFSYLFHPTEDLLYVSSGGALELWDPEAGARGGTIEAIRAVERMSISPDGRYLAVAGTCRTGCGDYDFCLYGLAEGQVLAVGLQEHLLGEETHEILDLVYGPDDEIVVWNSLEFQEGRQVTHASAANLRKLESAIYHGGGEPFIPGIRPAPLERHEHTSADGRWRVSVSPEKRRLYLYRLEPDSDPALEKFLRLP